MAITEKTIKIYNFEDLPTAEAKEKALREYEDHIAGEFHEFGGMDILDSAKAFCERFSMKIHDYGLTAYGHSYATVKALYEEDDDKGIVNACTSKLLSGQGVLTGVCFDEDFIDLVRENHHQTLAELARATGEKLVDLYRREEEYHYSDEVMTDTITANDYEFLEDGSFHQ